MSDLKIKLISNPQLLPGGFYMSGFLNRDPCTVSDHTDSGYSTSYY